MNTAKRDTDLRRAAEQVDAVVDDVFSTLHVGAREAAELWSRAAAADGTVGIADLAELRPLIEARLSTHPHFDGAGLVVDPGGLRDATRYQEWWRPTGNGDFAPLDLNTGLGEEPYDYTTMSWFVGAARGNDSVRGPYVDLAGADLYILTFAVPAYHGRRFIGASAADVTVAEFESLLIAELSALETQVVIVNSADRVVISNSPDHSPGERMRAASQTDTRVGGEGVNWRVHCV
jgi:hypothetical protein